MTNPDSTPGPALPVQKSDTPALAPTIPPAKPRPWYEFDPPAESAAGITQIPAPAPVPSCAIPEGTTPIFCPGKRRLYWSWDFTLVIDEEAWPPNKGLRFIDFHNTTTGVTALLRLCDDIFNSDLPRYIGAHVRNRVLEAAAREVGPGEPPKTEVLVKLLYDIKVWTPGKRPYERKGKREDAIKLERQVCGHIMAVKWSYERNIFRFARAEFRHLTASWIQNMPQNTATENALKQIKQELGV